MTGSAFSVVGWLRCSVNKISIPKNSCNSIMPCLIITLLLVSPLLWVCSAINCENLNYGTYHSHSMMARTDSDPCSRDLYRCGLQCQRDSGCRAFMDSENGGVEAVCSEKPGLLDSSVVYIIRREVSVQGTVFKPEFTFRHKHAVQLMINYGALCENFLKFLLHCFLLLLTNWLKVWLIWFDLAFMSDIKS